MAAFNVFAVLSAAAFLYAFSPAQSLAWVRCPFHALTGLYCPGCGTVRALHELLHGHILSAIDLNPLSMLLLPFLAYPFLSNVTLVLRGRRSPRVMLPPILGWLLVATVLAFWVLRNIPVWPLTVLAP
jgi:hypothetical protein